MARKRNDAGKFVKSVELPVKLKKQLAGGAVSARVDVTGYEVPKVLVGRVSWWRRWLGLGAPAANTDQWTDLKTRVMDELKTRQGDGGAAQPFVRPLLPEHRPAPEGDWLFRGFVLVSLAAIVVLLMLFAVLITSSKESGKIQLLGFSASSILASSSALFFVVLISHIDLRNTLSANKIFYMEYFYVVTYAAILAIAINSILFSWGINVSFVQYRDNLLPKLFYWPIITLMMFLVTLVKFY